MFMRLVQVKVKPEMADNVGGMYTEKIIPGLQQTPGCLYASLIRSTSIPDEAISLTIWETSRHAETYEQTGTFQRLLAEAQPYLAETSEWKVQLSKDLTLEYAPVPEEPVISSYEVRSPSAETLPAPIQREHLYVRILSVKLQPGKREEFTRLYNAEILPVLSKVSGCRFVFLTEAVEERNEVISLTVWDTREAADVYEASGLFRKLTRKVQHTFSELYQWKMAVEKRSSSQVTTTEDLHIRGYDVVSGTIFP